MYLYAVVLSIIFLELRVPRLFQHENASVNTLKFLNTWFADAGVKELKWLTQHPDLNLLTLITFGVIRSTAQQAFLPHISAYPH